MPEVCRKQHRGGSSGPSLVTPTCRKYTTSKVQPYGGKWPLAAWHTPRSLAQRRTSRMRSRARGSICPHSVNRAELQSGVAQFTRRSKGTLSPWAAPTASNVTLGSRARKADRRNLKAPLATRRSVQIRVATFCIRRASVRTDSGSDGWPTLSCKHARVLGLMLATISTSGTATPKAVPPVALPQATPVISVSGSMWRTISVTLFASCCTSCSVSGVGLIWHTSSSTCASKSAVSKVGGATGLTLGVTLGVGPSQHAGCPDALSRRKVLESRPPARAVGPRRGPGAVAAAPSTAGTADLCCRRGGAGSQVADPPLVPLPPLPPALAAFFRLGRCGIADTACRSA
mmetsp:Transcript_119008/g.332040  ORF Transcript_119008/g.332040 Transcript_119008/m.332040 type:complete len:344 (+) Transcript_119008:596-1627(+)